MPENALMNDFFTTKEPKFYMEWKERMQRALLTLLLALFPAISLAQLTGNADLEVCAEEFATLQDLGQETISSIEANFGIVSECFEILVATMETLGQGLADVDAAASAASSRSEEAMETSRQVENFSGRIGELEWDQPSTSTFRTSLLVQLQAQAACAAIGNPSVRGWVSAVPRQCDPNGATCATICANVGQRASDSQRQNAGSQSCFNALHIYTNNPSTELGAPGLKTYVYNSCGNTGCGPNFCCCESR
jgi:hypothetical protein